MNSAHMDGIQKVTEIYENTNNRKVITCKHFL